MLQNLPFMRRAAHALAQTLRLSVGGTLDPRPGRLRGRSDGPYAETKEHIGGFWVLEAADLDEALAWGRKAAVACRASVEVRPFH